MVAGFAKSFPQFTIDDILYKLSYVNLILYSSVIPGYDDVKEEEYINADDPRNAQKIRELLYE